MIGGEWSTGHVMPPELSRAVDFCAESLKVKMEEDDPTTTTPQPPPSSANIPTASSPTATSRKRGSAKVGGGQKKVQKKEMTTTTTTTTTAEAKCLTDKPKTSASRRRRPNRGPLQALEGPDVCSRAAGLASIVSAAASVVGRNVGGGSGDEGRPDAVLVIGFLRMQTHLFRFLRYSQLHFPIWADHGGTFLWHAANILGAVSLVDLAPYRLAFEDATAVIHPDTSTPDWPWHLFFAPLDQNQNSNVNPFTDPIPFLDVFSIANCLAQLDNYRRKFDSTFVAIDLRDSIASHIRRYPRAANAPRSALLSSAFAADVPTEETSTTASTAALPQSSSAAAAAPSAPSPFYKSREDWACKVPTSFGSQPWSSSDDDGPDGPRDGEDPPKETYPGGLLGWFRAGRGQASGDDDESSGDSEGAGDLLTCEGAMGPNSSNPGTLSILSMGKRPWAEGRSSGSPTTPRSSEVDLEVKSAVRGVYYDETSKRWCASWHEKKSGKKRSRYFAVKKFGFMPAKKLATEARLEAEETGECAPTNLHGIEPT